MLCIDYEDAWILFGRHDPDSSGPTSVLPFLRSPEGFRLPRMGIWKGNGKSCIGAFVTYLPMTIRVDLWSHVVLFPFRLHRCWSNALVWGLGVIQEQLT